MRVANRFFSVCMIVFFVLSFLTLPKDVVQASSPDLVISQVYGGAGCGTAGCSTFSNDFVEIFNRGVAPVNLTGLSVQYASASGSFNASVPLNGMLAPGQHYLVAGGGNANGLTPLPAPDASGSTMNMAATAGKVALVNGTTALACGSTTTPAPCSPAQLAQIIDMVGYGATATWYEAAAAPAPSTTTADFRAAGGCVDSDNNSADFSVSIPAPRNTTAPLTPCLAGDTTPPAVISTGPSAAASEVALNSDLQVTFSEPVVVTPASFSLVCETSGLHDFALSGGPASYTLNPYADFLPGEPCTAQVLSTGTRDLADNPLASDYAFSFLTTGATGALRALGTAVPSTIGIGGSTLLTLTVFPAVSPASTGILASCDLSPIGGLPGQPFFDDGSNGDLAAGDHVYSFSAATTVGPGAIVVNCFVADLEGGIDTLSFVVSIVPPIPPIGTGTATPASVIQGNDTLLKVAVTPGAFPVSTGLGVTCDLSDIGGSANQIFYDDGSNGDTAASDNTFSFIATVDPAAAVGSKTLACTIANDQGVPGYAEITLDVALQPCGTTHTDIFTLQGSGAASPMVGNTVTVEGVVSGDLTGSSRFGGFFIQDPSGDGDPATSDGVFVYNSTNPVAVGEIVRVSGKVAEYNTVTEISNVTEVLNCGTTTPPAPTAVTMPLPLGATLEPYEGMLVTFTNPFVVAQNYFLGRYGQMHLSTERFFNPTNGQGDTVDEFLRSSIVLDDGKSGQNPSPTPYMGVDNTVRAGDTIPSGLTGFLDQGAISSTSGIYGYRLQPASVAGVTIERANARPAAPTFAGSTLKVVGFNVENYFVTLDVSPYPVGGPYADGGDTPRGADSALEFTRQSNKLFAGLAALAPDVFGVTELESWDGADAPGFFAAGLNAAVGNPGAYAYVGDPATGVGSDFIQNGIFYKVGSVTPVGAPMSSTDPIYKRAPIAQAFIDANGQTFSVIVNHFKSKGSCPADAADPEAEHGQGCWNQTRILEAQALLAFIEEVKTTTGDPDVLVIGDLNAYGAEDPITTLTSGGLTNEMASVDAADRYSYIFDGYSGYLDQALSTSSLHTQVIGVKPWHINADEPSIIDYNTEYKGGSYPPDLYAPDAYRSSDHDPIVIGLNLVEPPVTPQLVSINPAMIQAGSPTFTLTVNGSGFTSDSVVLWDGIHLVTTFVNDGQLAAQVPAALVAAIGTADVTVLLSSAGTVESTALPFVSYAFADVLPGSWAFNAIQSFYHAGFTAGCSTGPLQFCPSRSMTRAEAAVFILKAIHGADYVPPAIVGTGTFTDMPVAGKEWMAPWVEQFYKEGMTSGCGSEPMRFCPERQVTRAEMSVFILRALHGSAHVPPVVGTSSFVDVPVTGKEWMTPWVEQFYLDGFTSGCSTSPLGFCPDNPVTRAQAAVFITNAFNLPPVP